MGTDTAEAIANARARLEAAATYLAAGLMGTAVLTLEQTIAGGLALIDAALRDLERAEAA